MPLFPEGTRQGHDPITLDVHKTYPAPLSTRESDKFVTSEQYPAQEEPITNNEPIGTTSWVQQQFDKLSEYMQPTKTTLLSIPLAVYGYGVIFLMILIALYVRYRKVRIPGKKKRRQNKDKKAFKKMQKGSNISVDPFLEQLAYD